MVSGHDLTGKTALVTGASSGLGLATARALVHAGASVVLPTRDRERGVDTRRVIRASHPQGSVELADLDLADLTSVRDFCVSFLDTHETLDILINNAAVMATPHERTADGFELQFGTNHLGHFALGVGLLPALLASGAARVVALSSIGHRRSPVIFDDLFFERRPYDKWSAYGQSKTACALFSVGLHRRYAHQGIVANAVHPGGIMTGLQKYLARDEQVAMGWIDADGNVNAQFKSVEQGAATSVWAALGGELADAGGLYLEDCAQALPFDASRPFSGVMDYALDVEAADRLWDLSLELTSSPRRH